MDRSFVLFGDICYTESCDRIISCPASFLVVEKGKITGVFDRLPGEYRTLPLYDYGGRLVIPGLSDLHTHASQYQFRGLWMDEELLDWLERHTFPEEARYSDADYALRAYSIFADDLLSSPTTRANIFATIHRDSALVLCQLLEERGLAANVGKVNMDRNCPPSLTEDPQASLADTVSFIKTVRERFTRVHPIVTPRFIPSCSDNLCRSLGDLAVRMDVPVQSHLSENTGELDWVASLCPESSSYADAYRRLGLWGRVKTCMAHCVWSRDREDELLENDNLYIAHCPDSNTNLSSGIFPARYFLDRGVHVGLGTDIAGGTSLSLFRAMTDAVKVSKLYWRYVDDSVPKLDFAAAFYMASKGGGSFFGRVGSFEEGYDADIVVLDDSDSPTCIEGLTAAQRLERYSSLCPEKPVCAKFVQGEKLQTGY